MNQTQHPKHRAQKTGTRGLSGREGRRERPGLKITFLKFSKVRNLLNQRRRISSKEKNGRVQRLYGGIQETQWFSSPLGAFSTKGGVGYRATSLDCREVG